MAGHNKWSKIKRDKASNDAKKGAIFTKLGNQIALAAKQGTDPNTNSALALVIANAKSANMPQTTIDRAIKRAADKASANLEEVLYEGYAQGGVAVLVECATDNRKRTFPEVKSTFTKNGGNIADQGSVKFNFERCGQIIIRASGDKAVLACLDAGALDVIELKAKLLVTSKDSDFNQVRQKLLTDGFEIEEASLIYEPKATVKITDEAKAGKVIKLLDALDDLSDVVNVYSNLE